MNEIRYQLPPIAITELVDAPALPIESVSHNKKWLLLKFVQGLKSLAELAQPEVRIAGLRINPHTNGPSRATFFSTLVLKSLVGEDEIVIQGLPEHAKIGSVSWSPDSRKIAFTIDNVSEGRIELWMVELIVGVAQRLSHIKLNGVFGHPFEWLADSEGLLVLAIPPNRQIPPSRSSIPQGPNIQENEGIKAPSRTHQDLIADADDEALLDFYATSHLMLIKTDGQTRSLSVTDTIQEIGPSPDGNHVLIKTKHRPYSRQLPVDNFPTRIDILTISDGSINNVANLPLDESLPLSFDVVPTGPRNHDWRHDVPATLFWVEAQDGGDPKNSVEIRDIVFILEAPFTATPQALVSLPLRYGGISWGTSTLALLCGLRWVDRKEILWRFNPTHPNELIKLSERSFEDVYSDPGIPALERNMYGRDILLTNSSGDSLYWIGAGASSEGERPFIDELNLVNGTRSRWWQSAGPYYEVPIAIIDVQEKVILTCRESQQDNPNCFLRNLITNQLVKVTNFPNPYPSLFGLNKKIIRYRRSDGVELSANLYLPVDYNPSDGALPTLLEAYPSEFRDRDNAGQLHGSPYKFINLYWGSSVYWVTQGYAVLEDLSIPIVGDGISEANDTYIEQLVASVQAAIEEAVRLGFVDPERIGIMGHSYGAFMVANLLAHSSIFKAGIARSGAYNRTLTPFGFQNEHRSYWEAPHVYNQMSPFNYADKIKAPLLLIHGEADNNPGTFPLQSVRFYNALKGHGATVRLVMLPLESHSYTARESIMHTLWEMNTWLNKYV
ncbi:Prolyl oligopeptidase family protein [Hymenobacter arizonensis]|uniref:Prolyl oligopeptidase family protein n=2 Tax=Hymenobacter arizonensis TaxID=1227077 RepID=A0A1I6BGV6_HYMAR|nr:Prolyl oligopeptidase family protein [Hymenobacter arizonensis]